MLESTSEQGVQWKIWMKCLTLFYEWEGYYSKEDGDQMLPALWDKRMYFERKWGQKMAM